MGKLRLLARIGLSIVLFCSLCACRTNRAQQLNHYGIKMALNDQWEEAFFYWEKAQLIDPDNPSVLNNIGIYYEKSNQPEKAKTFYEKALQSGSIPYIQNNLGSLREFEKSSNNTLAKIPEGEPNP